MKRIKIVLCLLLVLVLMFSLTGCFSGFFGVGKGGNFLIKDNEGNEVVIGAEKWDKSKMHGLPAPKAKLELSVASEDGTMYGFSEMKEKDAKAYIETIKSAGFTYNSITLDDFMYNGTNKDGLTINFIYEKESGSGSIISSKGDIPSDEENGAFIGGSDTEWDSSLMGGLPDPGVAVIAFWTVDGGTYYSLETIPSYMDYVEKIKACGFTKDIDEVAFDNIYIYMASNSTGDRVTFSVSDEASSVVFEKAN